MSLNRRVCPSPLTYYSSIITMICTHQNSVHADSVELQTFGKTEKLELGFWRWKPPENISWVVSELHGKVPERHITVQGIVVWGLHLDSIVLNATFIFLPYMQM